MKRYIITVIDPQKKISAINTLCIAAAAVVRQQSYVREQTSPALKRLLLANKYLHDRLAELGRREVP